MGFDGEDGDRVDISGKYLSIWSRQPDGGWKIAVEMFNADVP